MKHNFHEFALFSLEFSKAVHQNQAVVSIIDPTTLHRLQQVLRLHEGNTIILFDDKNHAQCTLQSSTKKLITLSYKQIFASIPVQPELIVLIPLLKREALDELMYACRELGVSGIYFFSSEKTSRSKMLPAEWERLERVSCAAAEQSKNFAPTVFLNKNEPIPTLTELCSNPTFQTHYAKTQKLFAEPSGVPASGLATSFSPKNAYLLCVGPEGDLTDTEKSMLRTKGFAFVRLGTTVLRAQQAATVLIGIIRSFT